MKDGVIGMESRRKQAKLKGPQWSRRSLARRAIATAMMLSLAVGIHAAAPTLPVAAQAGSPSPGSYECYTYNDGELEARGGLNFTIAGSGQYLDVDGTPGSFTFDPGSQVLTFFGGALDGQRAVFNNRNNPATITYLTASGDISDDECDLQQ